MRPVLFAFVVLSLFACESEEPSIVEPQPVDETPVCSANSYLSSVVDPIRARLEAEGAELEDCTRESAAESRICINLAVASFNGFVVEWSPAAEVQRAYIGARQGDGPVEVIRFERRSPFDQPWEQFTVECLAFGPTSTCGDEQTEPCFACNTGDAEPTYLCKDPE